MLVDGDRSAMAQLYHDSLQIQDPDVFLRHSEISDSMTLRLGFLRDFRNCLRLLTPDMYAEFVDELDKDTSYMRIAKFATREMHQESTQEGSNRVQD